MKGFKGFLYLIILVLIIFRLYHYFFEVTYICKNQDESLYILKLSPNHVASIYDQKDNLISTTEYYSTGPNSFVGENGWVGDPLTSGGMNVTYKDKSGKIITFYSGCNKVYGFFRKNK